MMGHLEFERVEADGDEGDLKTFHGFWFDLRLAVLTLHQKFLSSFFGGKGGESFLFLFFCLHLAE